MRYGTRCDAEAPTQDPTISHIVACPPAMATVPRETSAQQIGLVDACLEESAYDAALSLLNQARSDAVRPSKFAGFTAHGH